MRIVVGNEAFLNLWTFAFFVVIYGCGFSAANIEFFREISLGLWREFMLLAPDYANRALGQVAYDHASYIGAKIATVFVLPFAAYVYSGRARSIGGRHVVGKGKEISMPIFLVAVLGISSIYYIFSTHAPTGSPLSAVLLPKSLIWQAAFDLVAIFLLGISIGFVRNISAE